MTNTLLGEDDRAIIENLSAVLKAEGFQVRAEAGQREALEAIQVDALCAAQGNLKFGGITSANNSNRAFHSKSLLLM